MSKKEVLSASLFAWPYYDRHTFSPCVEKEGLVFISGLSAGHFEGASGKVVFPGDLAEQARIIFQKLGVILEAAALGPESVVKTVDFITPRALPNYRVTGDVRREFFKSSLPVSTGVIIDAPPWPEAQMVVDVTAVRGHRKELINPFSSRDENLTYQPGIRTGNILWLSGFTGRRYDPAQGKEVYPGDIAAQSKEAYSSRIERILAAAGATPADVVKSVDYIAPAGLAEYRETGQVRKSFYNGVYPAATGIIVNRLLRREAMVEIEVVAVLGDKREEVSVPEWSGRFARLTYCPAVKKGNLMFLSGQGPLDHETGAFMGEGNMAAQARKTYANIARVVEAAGASMEDIVKITEFVTPDGLRDYGIVADVRREFFKGEFPAVTGIVAHQLLRKEMLIEVDCIAVTN